MHCGKQYVPESPNPPSACFPEPHLPLAVACLYFQRIPVNVGDRPRQTGRGTGRVNCHATNQLATFASKPEEDRFVAFGFVRNRTAAARYFRSVGSRVIDRTIGKNFKHHAVGRCILPFPIRFLNGRQLPFTHQKHRPGSFFFFAGVQYHHQSEQKHPLFHGEVVFKRVRRIVSCPRTAPSRARCARGSVRHRQAGSCRHPPRTPPVR